MVLCVNNLGGLSCLEMAVVSKAAVHCLGETQVAQHYLTFSLHLFFLFYNLQLIQLSLLFCKKKINDLIICKYF